MSLRMEKVTRRAKDLDKIKRLFVKAFPKEERFPMWLLLMIAKRRGFDFVTFYDDAMFCGLTFVMSNEEMAYVLYLAVDQSLRSKGYGTKILDAIKAQHAGKNVALDIETVNPMFENYSDRVKRQTFYFRNGFTDTGYHLIENHVTYDILSSKKEFSPETCRKFFRKISFGLAQPVIKKR